jgi:hypothetical protein
LGHIPFNHIEIDPSCCSSPRPCCYHCDPCDPSSRVPSQAEAAGCSDSNSSPPQAMTDDTEDYVRAAETFPAERIEAMDKLIEEHSHPRTDGALKQLLISSSWSLAWGGCSTGTPYALSRGALISGGNGPTTGTKVAWHSTTCRHEMRMQAVKTLPGRCVGCKATKLYT